MKFELLVGVSFLLYILIVQTAAAAAATNESVEHFGVFGCTPVPFDKLLKDMYTSTELEAYLSKNWNDKTANEKNKEIADWDKNSCENQNKTYDMFVAARQKRDTVDALITK